MTKAWTFSATAIGEINYLYVDSVRGIEYTLEYNKQ
jgi:hypothetical protein